MNPTITTRVSIAWLSEPPSEPTSTLILSSPSGRFVDVRVFLDSTKENGLGVLEWANGGSASYTIDEAGQKRGSWTHEIDSRTDDLIIDTGILEQLPNGDVLEIGIMKDADGVEKSYQEIWHSVEVEPKVWKLVDSESAKWIGSEAESIVKDKLGRDARAIALRVGQWIQGIAKGQKSVVVFRARLSSEGVWKIIYQLGDNEVVQALLRLVTE
jgi:hypothetical protein